MATPPQKVSLYSTNDLKNATDDFLAPYLTSLPAPYTFRQDHTNTNVRLILGYFASVIAGVLFYFDWKLGWDATKPYTAPACVIYFILNGALTWWIWRVEAGNVFKGVRVGGQKLSLSSSAKKNSPLYKLRVLYKAPSGQIWEDKEIEGKFTQWFNTDGFLQGNELKKWLGQNIEVIGQAEPQSKASVGQADETTIKVGIQDIDTVVVGKPPTATNSLSPKDGARKTKRKA